MVTAENRQP